MDTVAVNNLVRRIENYGPRAEGAVRCSIEHLKYIYPDSRFGDCETLEAVAADFLLHTPEQQEYLLRYIVSVEEEAFDFFSKACYRYALRNTHILSRWSSLHFTEGGISRLSNIAGYLQGLAHGGVESRKLALKLALDLSRWLDYLSNYGGNIDIPCHGDSASTVSVPKYRVVVSDDGTLHGFTLAWFQAVSNEKRLERAEAIKQQRISPIEQLADKEDARLWDECLADAEKSLGLDKDLLLRRHYKPTWSTPENQSTCCEFVHYGYAFNGGLIYSGPGRGETFTVSVGNQERYWGVHT